MSGTETEAERDLRSRVEQVLGETWTVRSELGGSRSGVFLAEHVRLHALFAVKAAWKADSEETDLLAEAQLLKKLSHPMIPEVLDIFDEPDCTVVLEEYEPGPSLAQYLGKNGPVDEETGRAWFSELADVLSFLHRQEPPVMHLDIKPSNIILRRDGQLVLLDFGSARTAGDSRPVRSGSPGYMAPEQRYGTGAPDPRWDIYSLGAVMYQMMTGSVPKPAPAVQVPARRKNSKLSRDMGRILSRCMARRMEDRYADAGELAAALNRPAGSSGRRRRRGKSQGGPLAAAAVLAASAGIAIGSRLPRPRGRRDRKTDS